MKIRFVFMAKYYCCCQYNEALNMKFLVRINEVLREENVFIGLHYAQLHLLELKKS